MSNHTMVAKPEPLHPEASLMEAIFPGGGEMGERIRSFDWANHPLGPPSHWPEALKAAVSICLGSRFPIVIWWGKDELTQFYNDSYISFLGSAKHPRFFARSGRECWSEIWETMWPMWKRVFDTGEGTWSEDFLYVISRSLPREEGYFTFSYSPLRDDAGSVSGIFCNCYETTGRVLGNRRLNTLRDLGRKAMEVRSADEACKVSAQTLAANPADIPFALVYLLEEHSSRARLVATSGIPSGNLAAPEHVNLTLSGKAPVAWPLDVVLETRKATLVSDLSSRFPALPGGPWPESPENALVLPIAASGQSEIVGFLIVGLSPRLVLDADYRSFVDLVTGHIAGAIANTRAYEEERKRVKALAEIDRAKTAFFSNVSHEFRTPLTLMLGPLEEILANADVPGETRETLDMVHRNGLRLLRLVNSLLDFSRIEAGRIEATYEPVDLAAYTAELASVFRSAIEKAGLRLRVDCPALPEPVYVDREMWEKIVLNLLSNAFKFTFEGEITVSLRWRGERVELYVMDTGVGIPRDDLSKIFQRFQRVKNARSRTHEGTGIGLAIVQELVRLHGGEVSVQSQEGRGTAFTVAIQAGTGHLPADRINAARPLSSTSVGATPFVQEAQRWLVSDHPKAAPSVNGDASETPATSPHPPAPRSSARVLIVDDNADMRQYLHSLLAPHYEIDEFADGQSALHWIQTVLPDLVLTDVMMPELDGFGLLQRLRANERTRTVPVIMLSARAGEESCTEGLNTGADDYLVKPFGARELLARVESHLKLSRFRRETEERLEHIIAERTARLLESIGELEAFSYSIAHDMRAPLRAIQGFSQILAAEYAGKMDIHGKNHLLRMAAAADRMDRLIVDALNYGKVLRGIFPLETVDVRTLLQDILESYPAFQSNSVNIKLEGEFPDVLGNQAALTQCLSNLIGNAVKFVRPENAPSVRIWSKREDDHIFIVVQDNGIGIAESDQQRIFDIFQQVDNSRGGTGIGLAIVKKAAARMGGRVGLQSQLGKGSTFWIELKAA